MRMAHLFNSTRVDSRVSVLLHLEEKGKEAGYSEIQG
jgi:hypothetical protein